MNAEERQLIEGLFQRMSSVGPVAKDRDAEALIAGAVRQIPDAPYLLVQSVLVQEHALQQAGQRIEELEERVRQLEQQAYQPAPAQPASGGFLGGLFGGGAPAARPQTIARGAVPSVGGGRPAAAPAMARSGTPWGQQPPQGGYQPGYGAPPMQQAGGGGGFMKSAMATAAGVAGGMLLANSISGMLSGNSAAAAAGPQSAAYDPNATSAGEQPQVQDAASNDPGTYDPDAGVQNASDSYDADAGGDWGGDMDV